MPFLDMNRRKDHVRIASNDELNQVGIVMIETVRKNYEGFTKEQVERAKAARDALAMMAHPRADRVNQVVSSTSAVRNWPFTAKDLANGELIFGPDRGAMRGKTTRQRPGRVRPQLVSIPQQLYERIREVVLAADVMFVDGLPFFVTLSRGIKLFTIDNVSLANRKRYNLGEIEETVRDLMIQYVNPEIGIFLSKQVQKKPPVGREK